VKTRVMHGKNRSRKEVMQKVRWHNKFADLLVWLTREDKTEK
jgi:hypothetical protein